MIKNIILALGFLILGAFSYWLISPLFINSELDEALPETDTATVQKPVVKDAPEIITSIEADGNSTEAVNSDRSTTSEPRIYSISGTPAHPATGMVRVVTSPGEQIIRYEDYNGTNGPDLKIYLATDLAATEYIDLGPARANQGNINYGVPLDVNIDDYQYVLTWCEAFDVLFDYAEIH